MLLDRAIARAPDPHLEVAPAKIGLTGLDSYFWSSDRPRPIIVTAIAGSTVVTAEAYPRQYEWDFGDGSTTTSTNAGRRWTPRRRGSIAHLYETSGRYSTSVHLIWGARWRMGTSAWQPLGYFETSDTRRYPVKEVIAWLVPPR
ncbi:MAG TPA: hypothetical protein VFK89_12245 [Actinomycetota bacterium]|nr:hypothetical protein [Actinomycetota bacterium]